MASNSLMSTESAANAISRVRYTHDGMIDFVVANPAISQREIAKHFGYTEAWVSRVFCSDAFQARLAERKGDLVDPTIVQSAEERIRGLAMQSAEILANKLQQTQSPDLALKVFDISVKAAGYGARQQNVAIQNSFVVQLPNKIESAQAWADAHNPAGPDSNIIEAEIR